MSEQLNWWQWPFMNFAPRELSQPILPGWQFHGLEINFAGEPDIEKEVIEKVASYGKQLGIVTDALLSLAGDAPEKRRRGSSAFAASRPRSTRSKMSTRPISRHRRRRQWSRWRRTMPRRRGRLRRSMGADAHAVFSNNSRPISIRRTSLVPAPIS